MILYRLTNLTHTLDIYQERIVFTPKWWMRFILTPKIISYSEIERIQMSSRIVKSRFNFLFNLKNQKNLRFTVGKKTKSYERIFLYLNKQIELYKNATLITPVSLLTNVQDLLEKKKIPPTKLKVGRKSKNKNKNIQKGVA